MTGRKGDDHEPPRDPAGPKLGESAWDREKAGPTRSKKGRRRITLQLDGPPLALPGEEDAAEKARRSGGSSGAWPAVDAATAQLALPPEAAPSRPPRGDATEPHVPVMAAHGAGDGWDRAIEAPSAAMTRPRSVTPPPLVAGSGGAESLEESNDALSLVGQKARRPSNVEPVDFRREMLERFALGDYTGALRAAEIVLGRQPDDAPASECAGRCRDKLAQFYLARLGGGQRRLEVAVRASDVRWLGIDHRAGFLLSHVDGATALDDVVDVSGMPRHEALKLLVELFEAGAVRLL